MLSARSSKLRKDLRRNSNFVSHEQNAAFGHGLKLQEETITEMFLLKTARQFAEGRRLEAVIEDRLREVGVNG